MTCGIRSAHRLLQTNVTPGENVGKRPSILRSRSPRHGLGTQIFSSKTPNSFCEPLSCNAAINRL
jgi:hypothetical protein